jgi:pyrroloquinoline quinone (PQQ) biosynthesis protein C
MANITIEASQLLTKEELRNRLQEVGRERYHHRHPFHLLMHKGQLTRGQLQAWALNRYYYQSRIPVNDASHDGGIERWLRLAEATGLARERVQTGAEVLPAGRYAVDAYLDLVKNRSFLEAVASSLTELFSRDLIALRMDALRKHYPWLSGGLDYFTARLEQAPEDARFAFEWVAEHASTRAKQELAISALQRKCDILWAQLDALYFAYVEPGWPPPGAFIPAEDGPSGAA